MNICFFSGTIVSNVNFKFIITGKNFSASKFDLELSKNICSFGGGFKNITKETAHQNVNITTLKAIAYDNVADFSYRNLSKR